MDHSSHNMPDSTAATQLGLQDRLNDAFSQYGFMPHGHCYLWKPLLVSIHVISDTLIGMAYLGISATLYTLIKRINLPFNSVAICFGVFIGACGLTHFMEVWNLWNADYWWSAWVKVVTAIASVGTGIYLFKLRHAIVNVAEAAKLAEERRLDLEALTINLEKLVSERTAELTQSELKFRTITEVMPQLVWSTTSDGMVDYFNNRWYEFTGALNGSTSGGAWVELVHPDDRKRAGETWRDAVNSGHDYEVEYRLKHHSGSYKWVLGRAIPVRDNEDKIIRWMGSCTDIDEQKRNQKELERVRDEFSTLANNIPQLAWMTEPDGSIFWYNKQWFEYTGTTLEEMQKNGWISVYHPDFTHKVTEKWINHLENGTDWEDTFPIRSANGKYRWFLSRAKPIKDANGKIIRWFGTNTDIEEQRTNQLKLSELAENLDSAVKVRDEFLSVASHELKTPLTTILLQCQMQKRLFRKDEKQALEPERVLQYTEKVERLSLKLNRIVEDMLDISRIRSGTINLNKVKFDLKEKINEILEKFGPRFSSAGYNFPVFQGESAVGEWDPNRIEQVIENLLNNALLYGEKKQISLTLENSEKSVRVIIKDQGLGIAKEDQVRIFERFERVIDPNEVSGLGLGLFISQLIVKSHNGSISVESELGKGSSFIVELPK